MRSVRQELLKGQAPPAPQFIKGWVVMNRPFRSNVVAVYTVRAPNGGVFIAIDRVVPTQL